MVHAIEKKGIPTNQDIMVSYGTYTDSHLLSKFGFVNGDGSGHTEASIAVMHPLLDLGMGSQFTNLMKVDGDTTISNEDYKAQEQTLVNYLRYDDGYNSCISKDENPDGFKLKLLKLRHLQIIANIYDRWTFHLGPRNTDSKPSISSNVRITEKTPTFNPKEVKLNGSKIIATCRLIALTVDDYDGKAIEVLERALRVEGNNFMVPKQSDALEYRSLIVLARLTTGALSRYPATVPKDISSISSSTMKFQSKDWNAAHVRLGEMQSLEVLRSIATSGSKQLRLSAEKYLPSTHASLKIHRSPCPQEISLDLLADKTYESSMVFERERTR